MNCIIIEDEHHAADDLEQMLLQSGRDLKILAKIDDVSEAVRWLKNNEADLVFLDIQLHNNLCFEIFDHIQVKTPVIFTTSYNQYVIKSFIANNLAYLLKPIEEEELGKALDKYDLLYDRTLGINEKVLPLNLHYQKRFLIQSGNLFYAVPSEDIAYMYVQNRYIILVTRDKKEHVFDGTLKALEQRLDPEMFFRINPQCIININAIGKIQRWGKAKIKVETVPAGKEDMIISEERAAVFKSWLNR